MHGANGLAVWMGKRAKVNFIKITAKGQVPKTNVFKMRFKAGSTWEGRLLAIKQYSYSHPGKVYYYRAREGDTAVVRLWAERQSDVFLLQCVRLVQTEANDFVRDGLAPIGYDLWRPWVP